jgi:cytochrome P450
MAVHGIFSRGPEWKRVRSFVQTDLLSPQASQRYLPAALEAAEFISKGAPHHDDMNYYLNVASLDMFSNIMLGVLSRASDPTVSGDPLDPVLATAMTEALRLNSLLSQSPYEAIMAKLGFKTQMYKDFEQNFATSVDITTKKSNLLAAARSNGTLTPAQERCYVNQALERQLIDNGTITPDEALSIAGGLLAGGVDTTGGVLSWRLLHVASHPEAQDRIYKEISKHLSSDGKLTEEAVAPANAPFLYACMRESHRLANTNQLTPLKKFDQEITVHGIDLPAGSVVALDSYSTGVDPDLVDEPMEFKPQRFLKDAVMGRKGTPSEVVDHVFFSGPFSQGARKCPGSRVANLETVALLAQLVLDWEMAIPSIQHWTEVPYDLGTLTTAHLPQVKFTARSRS